MKSRRGTSEFNFWPSVADMILAVLMTFLLLWFAEKFLFLIELSDARTGMAKLVESLNQCQVDKKTVEEVKKTVEDANIQIGIESKKALSGMIACIAALGKSEREKEESQVRLARCQESLADCQQNQYNGEEALEKCRVDLENFRCDKPPIITLEEAKGYKFLTGKANLSEDFKELLQRKVKDIKSDLDKYKANVIEVIGHTDGQVAGGQSNLDHKLGEVIAGRHSIPGRDPIDTLHYGSNADLGLMRALVVVLFLRQQQELKGVKFRVYSAAQILPNGELTEELSRAENPQYRRIELRFTRLE